MSWYCLILVCFFMCGLCLNLGRVRLFFLMFVWCCGYGVCIGSWGLRCIFMVFWWLGVMCCWSSGLGWWLCCKDVGYWFCKKVIMFGVLFWVVLMGRFINCGSGCWLNVMLMIGWCCVLVVIMRLFCVVLGWWVVCCMVFGGV